MPGADLGIYARKRWNWVFAGRVRVELGYFHVKLGIFGLNWLKMCEIGVFGVKLCEIFENL